MSSSKRGEPLFDFDRLGPSVQTTYRILSSLLSKKTVEKAVLPADQNELIASSRAAMAKLSEELGWTPDELCKAIREKLEAAGLRIRLYHATRFDDKASFERTGVLPLDPELVLARVRERVLDAASGFALSSDDLERLLPQIRSAPLISAKVAGSKGPYLFVSRKDLKSGKYTSPHEVAGEFEEDIVNELIRLCDREGIRRPKNVRAFLRKGRTGAVIWCDVPLVLFPLAEKCIVIGTVVEGLVRHASSLHNSRSTAGGSAINMRGTPISPQHIVRVEALEKPLPD